MKLQRGTMIALVATVTWAFMSGSFAEDGAARPADLPLELLERQVHVREGGPHDLPSMFAFYGSTGQTSEGIPHLSEVRGDWNAGVTFRGIVFRPRDVDVGSVAFYVNGRYAGSVAAPPYILLWPELASVGTWTILAVADAGYAGDVTYTIR